MKRLVTSTQRGSALIIGLIVAAVLIAGGVAAYFLTDGFGSNDTDSTQQSASKDDSDTTPAESKPATTSAAVGAMFADVVAGKYDVTCTYDDGENTGTIYYSATNSDNVKMRFDTTSADYDGHVLRVQNTVYTWAEGQDTGTKLTIEPSDNTDDSQYSVDKYESDPGKYNLQCENAGTLPASTFQVPANVNFMDIGQYSGGAMGAGTN